MFGFREDAAPVGDIRAPQQVQMRNLIRGTEPLAGATLWDESGSRFGRLKPLAQTCLRFARAKHGSYGFNMAR
jgi:hypothetical protein